jgi:hypothetical protein
MTEFSINKSIVPDPGDRVPRIRMFLGLLDPDPSIGINKQINEEKPWCLLFWDFFMLFIFKE